MAQLGCGSLSDANVGGQNDCDCAEKTPVPKRHCHHLLQVRRRAWRQQTKTSSSVTEPETLDSETLDSADGMPGMSAGLIRAGKAPYRQSKEILGSMQPGMAGFRRKK